MNTLPKNKKKVSLERLSWNCNALRLIYSCCYFVESFYLIIRTNDRNCLFFIVYTHMYWTWHFYRQVKCLSISTEHRGIPCIFLFNMSSDGFNVCKFYVPRGSIHIFITFYLFFPFFCSKRRSYSKKARPFKIPRKLKPPLNAAHLFYFQILSCINFSIFFNISRK